MEMRKMMKRIFLIVLDSFGIGAAPDAADFGDENTNTLGSVVKSEKFFCPNLQKLGLFNIEGVTCAAPVERPAGNYGRLREKSRGKDTIIGHWELAGIISKKAMPVFPDGFPAGFVEELEKRTGRKCICNKPYSGTEVIKKYGEEHLKTGDLILYTSADSVCQIAANEAVIPVEQLYSYCETARELLAGDLAVGRVIARPFTGTSAENFTRTPNRHDFALSPPSPTMLDILESHGKDVISIGKIRDIFNGKGITESYKTTGNADGMEKISKISERDFSGLCFLNLVDFDMLYGHRRDVDGYAQALTDFDRFLTDFMQDMKADDLLMITADHGCDPAYMKTTDHTREEVPVLMYSKSVRGGVNYGIRDGFTCVANTVCRQLGLESDFYGGALEL